MEIELDKKAIEKILIKIIEDEYNIKLSHSHWKDYHEPSGFIIEFDINSKYEKGD